MLRLAAQGRTNPEIAETTGLACNTVKTYPSALHKLSARNRVERHREGERGGAALERPANEGFVPGAGIQVMHREAGDRLTRTDDPTTLRAPLGRRDSDSLVCRALSAGAST